jgi:hypothetical protein
MNDAPFNPAKRRLCPDGSCIGVIGEDGRCRVCGRTASGEAPPAAASGAAHDQHADEHGDDRDLDDAGLGDDAGFGDDDLGDDDSAHAGDDAGAGGAAAFDAGRRLCEDGDCLGVIGASGTCSVCGRAAAS